MVRLAHHVEGFTILLISSSIANGTWWRVVAQADLEHVLKDEKFVFEGGNLDCLLCGHEHQLAECKHYLERKQQFESRPKNPRRAPAKARANNPDNIRRRNIEQELEDGEQVGRNAGMQVGYDTGFEHGREQGYTERHETGSEQGHRQGYIDGYNTGYQVSFENRQRNTHTNSYKARTSRTIS
jgi:hypothetical protein